MKKLYTSAVAVFFVSGALMAQSGGLLATPKKTWIPATHPTHAPVLDPNRAIIWQDDFSDASTWSLGHDGSENLDWVIGTTGPSGSAAIAPINSTTASNGFGMVDSDLYGNSGTNYEQSHMTNATAIDLTGHANVILEFQTFYRKWTDEECYVVVQTSNTGWPVLDPSTDISAMPNVFKVWPGMATQAPVSNPTVKRFNISAVAGGQSTVYVRFYWSGIFGYAWMIDDVNIHDQYDYDAHMFDGFISHRGDGTEFGRIPVSQISGQMNVGGFVENLGFQPMTNVTLTAVGTQDGGGTIFTESANQATLNPGDTMSLDTWTTVGTLNPGTYTVTYTATSDQNATDGDPSNNTFVRTFEVTGDATGYYSLDQLGGHPAGTELLGSIGTDQFTGGADDLWAFTYYPVISDMTINGMELVLTASSVEGGLLRVSIHDSTNIVSDDPTSAFIESDDYVITANDIANGTIWVPLPTEYTLTPGAYYAGVVMYSNANANDFRILDDITVPQPSIASAIYIDQTYTNGNALAIRLKYVPVGIQETELKGVGMYPNPTSGVLNVTFNKAGTYNVEVINGLGEVVRTTRMSNAVNTIDLAGMAKGVYSVRVSNSTGTTVKRVTLN